MTKKWSVNIIISNKSEFRETHCGPVIWKRVVPVRRDTLHIEPPQAKGLISKFIYIIASVNIAKRKLVLGTGCPRVD